MGTVPFGSNNSVIDKNFAHKKFKNIYFVGSSSFPTSGYENPTQAAIATSLIATDNIIEKLNSEV